MYRRYLFSSRRWHTRCALVTGVQTGALPIWSNAEFVSTSTEHLLWYCRNRSSYHPNKFPRSDAQTARFSNPDDDPRGPWQSITFTISLMAGARGRQFEKRGTSPHLYEVTTDRKRTRLNSCHLCASGTSSFA